MAIKMPTKAEVIIPTSSPPTMYATKMVRINGERANISLQINGIRVLKNATSPAKISKRSWTSLSISLSIELSFCEISCRFAGLYHPRHDNLKQSHNGHKNKYSFVL